MSSGQDLPPAGPDPGPGVQPEAATVLRGWGRVAIALVLAGQGMAFGLAANQTPPETPTGFWVLHGGLAASALVVMLLLGGPLARECLASLRSGRITVDLLFLVSLLGALAASVTSTIRREGPVFYELVSILLAIYTVGKLLGARSRSRALQAVESLRAQYATCLRVTGEGAGERVAVDVVEPGQLVRVGAGETIAVDGVITNGRSLVLTTPLTGEPEPVARGPGDPVLAGMRAVDGVLTLTVTAAGGTRRLDAMLRTIELARLAPSRLQAAADRLAARFVPVVLLVCLGTFGFWLWRDTLVAAVNHSLAVLVVACPCALGLATPLGIWSSLVALGRIGIVARSGDFVEALATVDHACFDKTGTLFEPDLQVKGLTLLHPARSETEVWTLLRAAEHGIDHPVAHALRSAEHAPAQPEPVTVQLEARIVPGRGVSARVQVPRAGGDTTHRVLVGSRQLLIEAGIPQATEFYDSGRAIWVAIDDDLTARIDLREQPRAAAEDVFSALGGLGVSVEILTGDPHFPADRWPEVPRSVGLTPEEKAARVRAVQGGGKRVAFIGDGLNDAPALAAADVAIAIREGAELARSNALAVVGGASLGTLPAAVRLARAVRHAIRSNLRFAVAYNTGAIALAAAGLVHPVLAALLMAGSSVIVSTRVLRAGGSAVPAAPRAS